MMAKLKLYTLWFVQAIVALFFILQGVMKLTDGGGWAERFSDWGYPAGFVVVIGVIELLAGAGLLLPKTAFASAAAIIAVMLGAAVTHLLNSESQFVTNLLVIALCTIIIWARRPGATSPVVEA